MVHRYAKPAHVDRDASYSVAIAADIVRRRIGSGDGEFSVRDGYRHVVRVRAHSHGLKGHYRSSYRLYNGFNGRAVLPERTRHGALRDARIKRQRPIHAEFTGLYGNGVVHALPSGGRAVRIPGHKQLESDARQFRYLARDIHRTCNHGAGNLFSTGVGCRFARL